MSSRRKPRLRSTRRRSLFIASLVAAMLAAAGCTRTVGEADPDIDAARNFDRHPLYWVGERFEGWDLEHVNVGTAVAGFSYGTCEIQGTEGACPVPLQIQTSRSAPTSTSSPALPSGSGGACAEPRLERSTAHRSCSRIGCRSRSTAANTPIPVCPCARFVRCDR